MILVDNKIFFIQVEGDLCLQKLDDLKSQLSSGFDAFGEWEQMTLDLFNAGSVCSAAFNYIKYLHQVCLERDCQFMVIGCSDETLERLKLFRLNQQFPIGINKSSAELAAEKGH